MTTNTYTSSRAQWQINRLLALLAERPMTRADLCARMHMTSQGVCGYLQHLMSAPKRIRIAGYAPPAARGRRAPLYALGNGKDAPEPPRKTDREYYREMKRGDPDRYLEHLARHSALSRAKRRARVPQTWLSALTPLNVGRTGKPTSNKHNAEAP